MTEMTLQDANLQDLDGSAVKPAIQNIKQISGTTFDVQLGERLDDNAVVFHLYPAGHFQGRRGTYADWYAARDLLEAALMSVQMFGTEVEAGYTSELDSFFVIVPGLAAALDSSAVIQSFLRALV